MAFDGNRLHYARMIAHVTLPQLASETSVTVAELKKWEAGRGEPTVSSCWNIVCALGVSPQWLIRMKDDPRFVGVLTPDETDLVRLYRSALQESRKGALEALRKSSRVADIIVASGLGLKG